MLKFDQQIVEDSAILLADQELNVLGPELIARRCSVSLQVDAKRLAIIGATFIDCDITAKRLRNFLWHSASLQGCRFHGTYIGNDFGRRVDGFSADGDLQQCDFSDAILEGCRFFSCDPSKIHFPSWPCFTLLNPFDAENLAQLKNLTWPRNLGTWAKSYTSLAAPSDVVAVTECATPLIKRFGASEEEFKAAIARLANLRVIAD